MIWIYNFDSVLVMEDMAEVKYNNSISIYRKDSKQINPLKLIESMDNGDCNQAIPEIC